MQICLFSIYSGTLSVELFERLGKIMVIVETRLLRDLANFQIGFPQKGSGPCDAQIQEEIGEAHPRLPMKEVAQIGGI